MKVGSGSSSMADDDMARRPSTFDASSTPSLLPCLSSPPSEREARSVKWNTRNVLGSTFSFFLFFFFRFDVNVNLDSFSSRLVSFRGGKKGGRGGIGG